jgi:hypothetical protein
MSWLSGRVYGARHVPVRWRRRCAWLAVCQWFVPTWSGQVYLVQTGLAFLGFWTLGRTSAREGRTDG